MVAIYISKTSLHSDYFWAFWPFWAPLGLLKPFFGDPRRPSDVLQFLMFFRILFLFGFWFNLGPTWPRKGSQYRSKTDQKSKPKFIKFSMPLGLRFLEDFDGFWDPKLRQVGLQNRTLNDVIFKRWFFEKTSFFQRKMKVFEGSGGGSWDQNRWKIDQQIILKHLNMRRHLGSDFSSILVDLGGQVGFKLAPKYH